MEVQVRKLRDTIGLLEPAVPKKATLAVLTNILLKEGKAIANDLDVVVMVNLPEAQETMLLPAKDILEFLKYVPGDTIAQLSQPNKTVNITCGSTKSAFPAGDPQDFPPVTTVPVTFQMDGDRLVEALNMALVFAATEDTRPVLCGVTLCLEEKKAWVGAGDGFTMFYKELTGTFEKPTTMIIPTQAVEVLEHLWKHSPKSIKTDGNITQLALAKRLVDIGFDAGTITIQFGSVTVVSRLVQGTPPNWPALIPTPTTRVKFFAPDLLLAVSRLKSIAKEGSGIARLMWSGKTMKVSAQGESKSTESEIDLLEPSEGKIAMNHVYLRRYLKDKQSLVEMGTTDISSPILFQDGKSTVVVMPMFVQWDGEPVKEEKTEAPETAEETTAEGVSAETPEPKPAAKKKKAKSPRNKSTKTTKPKRKAKKA